MSFKDYVNGTKPPIETLEPYDKHLERARRDKPMIYASDRTIATMGDEEFNRCVQREATELISNYISSDYMWQKPDRDNCEKCYEWRRFPERHFGFGFWRICDGTCECAHHGDDAEVWI